MENVFKKLFYTAALLWSSISPLGLVPLKMNHTVSRVPAIIIRGFSRPYFRKPTKKCHLVESTFSVMCGHTVDLQPSDCCIIGSCKSAARYGVSDITVEAVACHALKL